MPEDKLDIWWDEEENSGVVRAFAIEQSTTSQEALRDPLFDYLIPQVR